MIALGERPRMNGRSRMALDELIRRVASEPPQSTADLIREVLGIDLSTSYAGVPIAHPFGKASGQLSCRVHQVEEDADAGMAFVVLKTVIAEGPDGQRSMDRWSNPETRMQVEPRIVDGRKGWTVTWKGRGWSGTLDEYLEFFKKALGVGRNRGLLVVPSVKYHLPATADEDVAEDEYAHTTRALGQIWSDVRSDRLVLEKDLSPTLAGDSLAESQTVIDYWLSHLTGWIRSAMPRVRIGVKLMNAMFDETFQVRMLRTVAGCSDPPDFLVVFNRLFDPVRRVAYGGWELSDRNLAVLDLLRAEETPFRMPMSATGNICSGKVMIEYALRGCENGQVHTFFQVPRSEYLISEGSRQRCALYTLLLHPDTGLVPWLWTLKESGYIDERDGLLHFSDVVGRGIR